MKLLLLALILTLAPSLQGKREEAIARFNRAVALQSAGRLDEAAAEYRAALASAPDYVEAQANLGVVLARLGRYDEAITSYEAALKIAPQLSPVRLNLGIAYYRAGRYERAVEVLREVLASSPGAQQARQLLGLALLELGRDEEAVAELQPAIDAAPQDAAALYGLGLAYLRLRRAEVDQIIVRLGAHPEGAALARLLSGQSYLVRSEFEKAIEELTAARALNAELPRLDYSFGLAYYKLGRNREAIESFEREIGRRPRDLTSLYYLALLNESSGQLDAAEKYLAESLWMGKETPEVVALRGKVLFKRGRAAEAIPLLERAAAAAPEDADIRLQLARAYQQTGRREEAAREFAAVQKLKTQQLERDRARTPKP